MAEANVSRASAAQGPPPKSERASGPVVVDPLSQITALDQGGFGGRAAGGVGAVLFHIWLIVAGITAPDLGPFVRNLQTEIHDLSMAAVDVQIAEEKPAEPPPADPEPEPEPEPEPQTKPQLPPPDVPQDAPPAAPAAAQAGEVLTAESDPDAPVDLTGLDTFVTGSGDSYAGGVTASSGKSKQAVYNRKARPEGVVGGKGAAPKGPPPVDRSAPGGVPAASIAQLRSCPFPAEADVEGVNLARVGLVISVDAGGRATSVQVARDPGFGFGRNARQCALRVKYEAPLDKSGKAIAGTLPVITIKFER